MTEPTSAAASQPSATSWAEVVRLRTLPAAVAPVILGGGAAVALGTFSLPRTLLAAGVALALQVGSNLANDYSDGVRGTDDDRTGPPRLTASGQVAPSAVKHAAFGCFGLAALLGLAVVLLTQQWWLLLAGVAAVAAAWFYTGGPRPYGYAGLGEVFVFVFFGLMATCGTVYIQYAADGAGPSVPGWVWLAACGIGLIACSLLMVNNLRDIDTDPAHGKRTLAVRLGAERARTVFVVMVTLPVMLGVGSVAWVQMAHGRGTGWASQVPVLLVALLVLSWAAQKVTGPVVNRAVGRDLIPVLRDAGLYELLYGVVIAAGLVAVA
ncbi:1,4-dihydroxy-2-naphthoate polyprenyltransferase [Actinomyces sp. W5033]|uniref:1,4-dihydroxy-2-naphthoate polyprenyltransferase n=1 Tax=Actinomyces sp. W5033 TaxID=3446479 RepID=UPI003EE0091A